MKNDYLIQFKNFGYLELVQFIIRKRIVTEDLLFAFKIKFDILFDEGIVVRSMQQKNMKYLTIFIAMSLDQYKYRNILLELLNDFRKIKIVKNGKHHICTIDQLVCKSLLQQNIFSQD